MNKLSNNIKSYNNFNKKFKNYLRIITEEISNDIKSKLEEKGFKQSEKNPNRFNGKLNDQQVAVLFWDKTNQIFLYKFDSESQKLKLVDRSIKFDEISSKFNYLLTGEETTEKPPKNETNKNSSNEDEIIKKIKIAKENYDGTKEEYESFEKKNIQNINEHKKYLKELKKQRDIILTNNNKLKKDKQIKFVDDFKDKYKKYGLENNTQATSQDSEFISQQNSDSQKSKNDDTVVVDNINRKNNKKII